MNTALLLSVKAEFAEMIFAGTKTVELRRQRPRVAPGDYLILYVPAPFKRVAGIVTVGEVIEARVHTLWRHVRLRCGISYGEFRAYFSEAEVGFGVTLHHPARLAEPLPLEALRTIAPGFSPQGYKYLTRDDITKAISQLRPHIGSRGSLLRTRSATRD